MKIFVIINDDGYVQKVFKEKYKAINYCQEMMTEQLLDPRDWECYFRIDEAIVK